MVADSPFARLASAAPAPIAIRSRRVIIADKDNKEPGLWREEIARDRLSRCQKKLLANRPADVESFCRETTATGVATPAPRPIEDCRCAVRRRLRARGTGTNAVNPMGGAICLQSSMEATTGA